jgi:hypothetical protein
MISTSSLGLPREVHLPDAPISAPSIPGLQYPCTLSNNVRSPVEILTTYERFLQVNTDVLRTKAASPLEPIVAPAVSLLCDSFLLLLASSSKGIGSFATFLLVLARNLESTTSPSGIVPAQSEPNCHGNKEGPLSEQDANVSPDNRGRVR